MVVEKMRGILRSPEVLAHAVREVGSQRPKVDEAHAVGTLQSIDAVWDELFPAEQAKGDPRTAAGTPLRAGTCSDHD